MKKEKLKIIGSEEWCVFEAIKIPAILARVDSGAKTSSIQAADIKLIKRNDDDWVQFVVYPLQRNRTISVTCEAQLVGKRSIKGSFGISEERLIIKTPVTIDKVTFEIELSLANRNTMEFRMLLGREAIADRFLVHSAEKHLLKVYSKEEIKAKYKSHSKVQSKLKEEFE